MTLARHCEERRDAAIQNAGRSAGLPRFARYDECLRALTFGRLRLASSREPNLLFASREAAKARRGFVLRLLGHNMPSAGA